MLTLTGKVAVVTGGGNGIGAAIVVEFLLAGANVVAVDKDHNSLAKLKQKMSGLGYQLKVRSLDISEERAVKDFWSDTEADILVNNAGLDLPYIVEDNHNWSTVFDVNVNGTRLMTEYMVRKLIEPEKTGNVIFVTSVHTALGFKLGGAYDASKHAIIGYMRTLVLNHGSHIRFNAVAPGAIYPTKITAGLGNSGAKKLGQRIPAGRCGKRKEVAKVCRFLSSADANYVNGAEIRVDGGLAIKNSLE